MNAQATRGDSDFDMFSAIQSGSEVATAPIRNPSESLIRKCLHPPSAVPGFSGIPTNDARTQVLLQYSNIGINKTPFIFDKVTGVVRPVAPADLQTFNYALLLTNGLRVNAIPFIYNATSNNWTQDFNNVDTQDAYDVQSRFALDAQVYRPIYKSTTTLLNATAFNDTGIVACNQFNPNILFAGTLWTMALQCPQHFYGIYKQCHDKRRALGDLHVSTPRSPDHSTHVNNFTKFPVYVQDEIRRHLGLAPTELPTLDPSTSVQVIELGGSSLNDQGPPVPSPSQLLNQSLRAYSGKAKDGLFSIQRLNTITPAWLTSNNLHSADHGLFQCYYYYFDSAGLPHYAPFGDNQAAGPLSAGTLHDTMWSKDMTFSWIVYEGLSLNSQTSTSTQLLIKKYYTGYEVQPAPLSAWAGTVKLAPEPNLVAMQAMMDGFYQLKDGMPAKYNFWGTLGTILGPSLLQAGGSALKWLTGKLTPSGDDKPDRDVTPKQPTKPKQVKRKPDKRDAQINALTQQVQRLSVAPRNKPKQATAAKSAKSPSGKKSAVRAKLARNEPISLRDYMRLPPGGRP